MTKLRDFSILTCLKKKNIFLTVLLHVKKQVSFSEVPFVKKNFHHWTTKQGGLSKNEFLSKFNAKHKVKT